MPRNNNNHNRNQPKMLLHQFNNIFTAKEQIVKDIAVQPINIVRQLRTHVNVQMDMYTYEKMLKLFEPLNYTHELNLGDILHVLTNNIEIHEMKIKNITSSNSHLTCCDNNKPNDNWMILVVFMIFIVIFIKM